ncbi:sugar ABC transporter substrate-binding protein [Mycolicibacterium sp.]|uniref:sugar ABC transporter substrate-binding protein n=1 Tax=Mycolicibacterium sp. TaxID=2320850 RepID=UPI003D0D255C
MAPVTEFDRPTVSFTPPRDKRIMILVCGSGGQGCGLEADEQKRAAEALGWKVDMVDGKLDPNVWNQAVQQAVDSHVDGIIAVSSDPNLYGAAMDAVAARDVPFVLTNQMPQQGDPAGIDTYLAPDPVTGGNDVADWIIADSEGSARVLLLDLPGYRDAVTRTKTIEDDLARDCPECVVHRADISAQTMGTSLAPLVTSQLQQHQDVTYVWSADDAAASFVAQGIQQAGKGSSVKLVSMGGFPDQLARVRSGQVAADLATATPYTAWLAVDSLARLMAGQPAEKYWAVPQRLWTSANIGEADDEMITAGWDTDIDFRSSFQNLWGLQ